MTIRSGPDAVEAAVRAIHAGQPVVLPTDTVYGVVVDGYRAEPVEHLYRLKRRDQGRPIALLASDLEAIFDAVPELHGRPAVIARALLPGPLTLVLPNPARRFRWVTGSTPTAIGIRVPELSGDARAVLDRVGVVAATSANLSGSGSPARIEDVPSELLEQLGAVIDAGPLPGVPSTVVDLTDAEPRILREGLVSAGETLSWISQALPETAR